MIQGSLARSQSSLNGEARPVGRVALGLFMTMGLTVSFPYSRRFESGSKDPHTSWCSLIMDAGRECIGDKVPPFKGQPNLHLDNAFLLGPCLLYHLL